MKFSIVIPTVLRPELVRAVNSARHASEDDVEIVVVVDKPREDVTLPPDLDADQVIFTGGSRRGGTARNLGVKAARGEWIAFLDDDDYWRPKRLDSLWSTMKAWNGDSGIGPNEHCVYASRVQNFTPEKVLPDAVPAKTLSEGEDIATYLFAKRGVSLTRASLFTSTLVAHRDVALEVPWDPDLPRHQDWDWILKVHESGHQVVQFDNVDTFYRISGAGSVSAGANWAQSLSWFLSRSASWPPQAKVDFVIGQPMRYALQARSLKGLRTCLKEAIALRTVPTPVTVVRALTGLVPRTLLARAATATVAPAVRNPEMSGVR